MTPSILESLKYGTLGLAGIVAFLSYQYLMRHQTVGAENRKALTSVLRFSLIVLIVMVLSETYSRTLAFVEAGNGKRLTELRQEVNKLTVVRAVATKQRRALEHLRVQIRAACGEFGLLPGNAVTDNCPDPAKVCVLVHSMLTFIDFQLKEGESLND